MTQTQKECILLLNMLIGGPKPQRLPDYEAVIAYGRTQSLGGILENLASMDVRLPVEQRRRYFIMQWSTKQRSRIQQERLQALQDAFQLAGIRCVPIKGQAIRQAYPDPELRIMGDIDLLCRPEQRRSILQTAVAAGYFLRGTKPLSDAMLEFPTSGDTIIDKDGYMIELHYNLFPVLCLHHPQLKEFLSEGLWERSLQDETGLHLDRETEFLLMIFHIASHLYHKGCGIRFFLDIALYQRCYGAEMNWKQIQDQARSLGFEKFFRMTMSLTEHWFPQGNTHVIFPMEPIAKELQGILLNRGSFGNEQDRYSFGRAKLCSVHRETGQRLRMYRLIFPPIIVMRSYYPILNRMGILYPVVCLYHNNKVLRSRIHQHGLIQVLQSVVHINKEIRAAERELDMLNEIGL